MKKDSVMKPFADKFKADAMKTYDIYKSLEKVLPDYVSGGKITAQMKDVKDEVIPSRSKQVKEEHEHAKQSPFKLKTQQYPRAVAVETDGYGTVLFEIYVISNHLRGSVYRAEILSLYPY